MPTLYDEDMALWAEQQSRLLRAAAERASSEPIDWDNVAEEIESVGKSQAHELRKRLSRIVEHLLKLQFSPAQEPRRGWLETILQQRAEIEYLLHDSPSLHTRLPEMLEWVSSRAAGQTAASLALWGEAEAGQAATRHGGRYTLAEILDHELPAP